MIVVKVGGSLFDHPALGAGLRAFVDSLAPKDVLLVPGGGPVAEAVRELDRVHKLGEEAAHWLALRALGVTADLLRRLLEEPTPQLPPDSFTSPLEGEVGEALRAGWGVSTNAFPNTLPPTRHGPKADRGDLPLKGGGENYPPPCGEGGWGGASRILDPFAFALEDESRPSPLPHTWRVTTDSIAARVAFVHRAERLILLKSVDIPPLTPWPEVAANGWVDPHFPQVASTLTCPVEIINFRRQLDARA